MTILKKCLLIGHDCHEPADNWYAMKSHKLFLAIIIYLTWVIVFSIYSYHSEREELLLHLDQRLEIAARNYIYILPGNLHHKKMVKSDLSKEQNLALLLKSNEYTRKNGIYYIYSMIKKDSQIYFTAGNAYEDDMAELKGGGYYFYHYEEAEPSMYNAFEQKHLQFHETNDHWGNFRTVLIRYISDDGVPFVIGADFTTDHIQALLNHELLKTSIISLFFFIFAVPAVITFTASTREWAKSIKLEKEKAEANEAKLSSILSLAADAIITISSKGIITDFNKAASSMFRYSKEEAVGNNVTLIIPALRHDQNDEQEQLDFKNVLSGLTGNKTEQLAKTKDGCVFTIDLSLSEITLDNKQMVFSAIIRDLTDTIQREKQLHKLIDQAESANRAKSDFLDSMSHELRTPLHGILAYADIGLTKYKSVEREKLHEYFSIIDKSGVRLKLLLDDLLDLSKLEAEKMELRLEQIDISELISDCISEQSALITSHHLEVSLYNLTESSIIECDSKRIAQVVLNLLSNAIKFSPQHSMIEITISAVNAISQQSIEAIEVMIADHGSGVPKDQKEFIFEKFIQASGSKFFVAGTGLGLAISREIIKLHHGDIWYQDNQPDGSKFIFRVPLNHPQN